jgi:predicted porin
MDMSPSNRLSKTLQPLAAAALLVISAGAAHAQASNVTLFGVVDAGVRNVKNGDQSINSASSNGINTSRFGVRGTEDLGGGLRAGFWLESGLTPDTGSTSDAARFWNRRSTVSLLGTFGEVRLGRDYAPSYSGWVDFDTFGDNGVAAGGKFAVKLGSTVDTNTRADNQVQYIAPALGGFYGTVSAAAGEGTSGKKYYGGRAGYAAGPLNVSVAYGETTVTANAQGDDKYSTGEFGAAYNFGIVKVNGYFQQEKWGDVKLQVTHIGASVPLGSGTVRVGYTNANASGRTSAGADTSGNDANQLALGYVYDLSKRTAVYGTLAKVSNKGSASYVVESNPVAVAGKDSTGYEIGLRHSF